MSDIYLGLIHHPILDKRGEIITTSVTNLDIHDIARSCRTFGLKKYFIVTPIEKQHQLVSNILDYWNKDFANDYNPDRASALSFIEVENSFEDSLAKIEEETGVKPIVAMTGANFKESDGSIAMLQEEAKREERPIFLIFGTGWGLHPQILERNDFFVDPIRGIAEDGYNHLSVRSAVAIYLSQFI